MTEMKQNKGGGDRDMAILEAFFRSLWQEQDDGGAEPEEKFSLRQYSKVACRFRPITDVSHCDSGVGKIHRVDWGSESLCSMCSLKHVLAHHYLKIRQKTWVSSECWIRQNLNLNTHTLNVSRRSLSKG